MHCFKQLLNQGEHNNGVELELYEEWTVELTNLTNRMGNPECRREARADENGSGEDWSQLNKEADVCGISLNKI